MLSTFERVSVEKQNSVLNAAASVFAEEGYHFARISKICQKAGISNGALYKYFKNKESLFMSVIDYTADLVERELYVKCFKDIDSIYHGIRKLLWGMVEFTKENRDYISIYSDLGSSSMNRFAAIASHRFKSATSLYTVKLIEKGKEKGEINKKITNELAACLIDNYLTLFSYSLVSEYHLNRFDSFFCLDDEKQNEADRIDLIIDSINLALR